MDQVGTRDPLLTREKVLAQKYKAINIFESHGCNFSEGQTYSLVNQTLFRSAGCIIDRQHAEGGYGDSGHYSVARWNAVSREKYSMIE